jgi:HEAT repeat protein
MDKKIKKLNNSVEISIFIIILLTFCLFSIGCSQADPLIADLKGEDSMAQIGAAQALGLKKDAGAVEPLIAALKDEESNVRAESAQALGVIKDTRAVEPLIAALEDKEVLVQWEVINALGQIRDARAVKPLIAILMGDNVKIQYSAAQALGQIKDASAVEPLIAALKNENSGIRNYAADTLGQIQDARAVMPLISALKDVDFWVREQATQALLKIGAPAVEPMFAALKKEDLEVISGGYNFFIARGEKGSETALIKALNKYDVPAMAQAFLNCGNSRLAGAGSEWSKAHGFYIMRQSSGGGGPTCGSSQ